MKHDTANDNIRAYSERETHDAGVALRVWWIPQVPMPAFEYPVPTVQAARLICDALAQYDLFQLRNNVKPDYDNAGGASWRHPELTDGDWCDFDPEDEDECSEVEAAISKARGALAAPTAEIADILTVRKNGVEVVVRLVEPQPGDWRLYHWEHGQLKNWNATLGRRFASRVDALRFIQENGYDIAQTSSNRVYRFRAECQPDVDELRLLLGLKVTTITMTQSPPFPDIEAEIVTGLTLEELRDEMRQIVDGHVMVQTVARTEEYTGERDYEL